MDLSQVPESAAPEQDHTEEFKQALGQLMNKIHGKMEEVNATDTAMNMKNDGANKKLLGQFFDSMKAAGFDPSDQQAVGEYLDFLKENQPDIYAMIESMLQQSLPPQQDDAMAPPPSMGRVQPLQPMAPPQPPPGLPSLQGQPPAPPIQMPPK